jgi:hypothetical protein
MLQLRCAAGAIAALLLSSLAVAAAAESAGYKSSLFNGRDLDGWQVAGCKPTVEAGLLVLGGPDGWLRTNEKHGDFVLELDWRARKASEYDSGIYIRAAEPAEGKPFPDRYQINLKQGGEGNLLGLKGATSSGLIKPGEWNHFKITVVGDRAELEINGQPAWKAEGLTAADGYIGLQSEVPLGGAFEFRNIELTDLDYQPLFNGTDLTGWTGDTRGYAVEDGAIVCKPLGGRLFTADEYADFSFRFDFKMSADGNNGVGIRSPLSGDPAYVAMEVQVLDDHSEKYAKMIQPWQAHGSVYGIVAAKRGFQKPLGEWNHEEIIANGRHVTVILNGHTIVDADVDAATSGGTLDGKEHPGVKNARGHIGFLGHGARVEFDNMRVKVLNTQ